MILDSIRLHNFGAYGGLQEAVLTPEPEKPVVLFGGMNGGGKTTLLDALQLVLYGPKARVSNRGRMAYTAFLKECIHRGADPDEGAGLVLRFRRVVDGKTRHYELQRSWREGVKGIEETVRVHCDGELDEIFTEHWDEVIESYLPVAISNLFFFDGEQIKELAESSKSAAILGSAIRSLLGLDLVDRLEDDLRVFERKKRSEGLDPETARQYELAREELQRLVDSQDALRLERGGLVNEAGRLGKLKGEKEEAFRVQGGELFLRRQELEGDLARLKAEKQKTENSLRELAAGPLPLLLVNDLLTEVEEQARHETEIRHNRLLVEALEGRDEDTIGILRSTKLSKTAIKEVERELARDRKWRLEQAGEELVLDADDQLAPHVAHLAQKVLPEASERSRDLLATIRRLDERIARAEAELERVPEEENIATAQEELKEARIGHAKKLAELDGLDVRIEALKRQQDEAKARLDRFGERDLEARQQEDDRIRMLRHSAKVRGTLEKFRESVIRKHLSNLEALMLECFRKLLRKTDLVHALSIDPGTFEVTLKDRRGQALPFDRLSAGERQLLATAMLWGLARASGRPIPTVIDTPLGRLDSSHRKHLVTRYFPFASHQVILLSTDEEIVGPYHGAISPAVARQYVLDHDEQLGQTSMKDGYFEYYEATS